MYDPARCHRATTKKRRRCPSVWPKQLPPWRCSDTRRSRHQRCRRRPLSSNRASDQDAGQGHWFHLPQTRCLSFAGCRWVGCCCPIDRVGANAPANAQLSTGNFQAVALTTKAMTQTQTGLTIPSAVIWKQEKSCGTKSCVTSITLGRAD